MIKLPLLYNISTDLDIVMTLLRSQQNKIRGCIDAFKTEPVTESQVSGILSKIGEVAPILTDLEAEYRERLNRK